MRHLQMMNKAAVGLLLILLLAVSGCRDQQPPAAASVDEALTTIDLPLLQAYRDRLARDGGEERELDPEAILRHVANMTALLAEGREQGLSATPAFRQAVHQHQAELLLRAMQADLLPAISREGISDEEVWEFFTANLERYSLPESMAEEDYFARRKEYLRNDVLLGHYRRTWDEVYQRLRAKHGIEVSPDVAGEFRALFN